MWTNGFEPSEITFLLQDLLTHDIMTCPKVSINRLVSSTDRNQVCGRSAPHDKMMRSEGSHPCWCPCSRNEVRKMRCIFAHPPRTALKQATLSLSKKHVLLSVLRGQHRGSGWRRHTAHPDHSSSKNIGSMTAHIGAFASAITCISVGRNLCCCCGSVQRSHGACLARVQGTQKMRGGRAGSF